MIALFLDLDGQTLDFLIQRGERDMEAFGRFGLVPAAFFQHIDDDATLTVFHDAEERGARAGVHSRNGGAAAYDVIRQQVGSDIGVRGENYSALDGVLQFADVAGPRVGDQRPQCFGAHTTARALVFVRIFLQEMLHQHGNVFATLAERREIDADYIE